MSTGSRTTVLPRAEPQRPAVLLCAEHAVGGRSATWPRALRCPPA
jgi:hypothetical protein